MINTMIKQFLNRKVVHQETYSNYIIIVTQREPVLTGIYNDYYTTYICNERFDVLRRYTHNAFATVEYLVENAKIEINPFVI